MTKNMTYEERKAYVETLVAEGLARPEAEDHAEHVQSQIARQAAAEGNMDGWYPDDIGPWWFGTDED